MKRWLKIHPQVVLGSLAFLFISIVVFSAIWSVRTLVLVLGTALNAPQPHVTIEKFDIEAARMLDLRGLVE